ncbi:DUF4245 domain-containing protein [Aeromicrobium sp.]|uniref:DUF4245 domain-containing protein n=1 Tax=Aeromicrobium sp. TaxID=1871063 RepID=UPI0019AE7FA5|nr:DUF4245 domain-containing protein [Aeromicrobium sp.]MBC7633482.1 DUF4245 domain-containing protein [Aeromicrobium sp.]
MSTTRSTRGNPSMGDILRSMAVIALIVLAIYGIGKLFTTSPGDQTRAVDYVQTVEQARPSAGFALLAPAALPAGWKATSARFDPAAWHLGVLTDDKDYIGLEQVTLSVDRAVTRFADGSTAGGTADIAGSTWTVRNGPRGRLTLVRHEGELTTLINATAPRAVVESYVASLSTS